MFGNELGASGRRSGTAASRGAAFGCHVAALVSRLYASLLAYLLRALESVARGTHMGRTEKVPDFAFKSIGLGLAPGTGTIEELRGSALKPCDLELAEGPSNGCDAKGFHLQAL